MVEADGCQNGHHRMSYGVGRIQASAQACLQHQVFHACLLENHHSNQEQQLKIRGMRITLLLHDAYAVHHLMKSLKEGLVGYLLLIDDEALIDIHQMRRCEQTGPLSRRVEHGGQERTHGALSVGSRHVQNLHPTFRTPEPF